MKFTIEDLLSGKYNRKVQRERIRKFSPPVEHVKYQKVNHPTSENHRTYPAPPVMEELTFPLQPTKLAHNKAKPFSLEDIKTVYILTVNDKQVKEFSRLKNGMAHNIVSQYVMEHINEVKTKDVFKVWAIRKTGRTLVYTYSI